MDEIQASSARESVRCKSAGRETQTRCLYSHSDAIDEEGGRGPDRGRSLIERQKGENRRHSFHGSQIRSQVNFLTSLARNVMQKDYMTKKKKRKQICSLARIRT